MSIMNIVIFFNNKLLIGACSILVNIVRYSGAYPYTQVRELPR